MKLRLFLIFIVGFASAFNTFSVELGSRPFSAGLIATALYFMALFPVLNGRNINKTNKMYGRFIYLPVVFCLLFTLMNLVYYNGGGIFPFSIFMNWILMYVILCHSLIDNKAIDYCLYGFSFGAIVLSVLFYLGIGVEVNIVREGERFSMFGSNENVLGIIQAISIVVILNLFILKDRLHLRTVRFVFVVPLILSSLMIVATGSRTALLILAGVFVASLLFYQTKKQYKVFIIVVGVVAAYSALQWLLNSDASVLLRLISSVEDGNTGGRTDIWNAYLVYYPEHPLFGVGEEGMLDLAKKSGVGTTDILGYTTALSPHNVLIEVLLKTGAVGLLIMGTFWWKTFKRAFKGLKLYLASLPVVLIIPIGLVLVSGQLLEEKYAWFIYAYMIAASCGRIITNEIKKTKRNAIATNHSIITKN